MLDSPLSWVRNPQPDMTLNNLHTSGELAQLLPEVERLYGVPQNSAHHPEVCTGRHIELCLQRAAQLNLGESARIAVLLHDLGKGLTPPEEWPRHLSHESTGVPEVQRVATRLGLDSYTQELALSVCQWHLHAHRMLVMTSSHVLRFFEGAGLLRSKQFRDDFIGACFADATGRLGLFDKPYPQAGLMADIGEGLAELPTSEAPIGTRDWQFRHNQRLRVVRAARSTGFLEGNSPSC